MFLSHNGLKERDNSAIKRQTVAHIRWNPLSVYEPSEVEMQQKLKMVT